MIAQSNDLVEVEGNKYFPESSLNKEYVTPSPTTTTCPWKGKAKYYTLEVDGQKNEDAAWFYPEPKDAAGKIRDRVAFWKGVRIEED